MSTIPSKGFSWYIFFLLDKWSDPLRDEVEKNFSQFAAEVGSDCLAVQGTDRVTFYNQILDSELMKLTLKGERPPLPALIVSNYSPGNMDDSRGIKDMSNAQLMIFPLAAKYIRPGSITEFLKDLATTLKDGSPEELQTKEEIQKKWSWLIKYFELKPSFFGFVQVNVNQILEDLFQ
ncbi:hypothetical protein [Nostoc sp. NOS(2021)]|uniref:hypothetical protein n=1 Tax=Nostoc sp. NOS(2021) TaxID=2815407 RepID=UPI0025FB4406|nr:hypothetical protein [Nostoc sp. NOS(2021)]